MVEHSQAVSTAAAAIVALINERPQSPRQDEIEAIIAKAMAPQPMATARLVELRRAIATVEAAEEEAGPGEARTDATQDRIDRLYAPFDAMTQAVWDTPPTSPVDLHERAIIARHWFNVSRADWENPCDLDDWGDQAIAQLIHGVLQFAGSDIAKAMAPARRSSHGAPVPKLTSDIRAKIAELDAAYAVLGPLLPGPEHDAADSVVERLKAELCDLEEQIPKPPRSFADIRMFAELALYWAAEGIEELRNRGNAGDDVVANLIEAVLQFDVPASEPKITGPVIIKFDKQEFALYWLGIAEMAVKLLAKDTAGVRAFIENTFSGDFDEDMSGDDALSAFMADLESLSGKCASLSEIARVAWARILAAFPDEDDAPSEFGITTRDGQRIQEIRDI